MAKGGSVLGMGSRINIMNELGRTGKAFHEYDKEVANLTEKNLHLALKALPEGITLIGDILVRIAQAVEQELDGLGELRLKHAAYFAKNNEAKAEIEQIVKDIRAMLSKVRNLEENIISESRRLAA